MSNQNLVSQSEVIMNLKDINLSFGGLKALSGVNLQIKKGEILAIIGPNGAGKSSMLNIISGIYVPQKGVVEWKGKIRKKIAPHDIARMGIARTFQNIALFKGMSALENILTGRNILMKRNLIMEMIYMGLGRRQEEKHRKKAEEIIDFLEIQAIRKTPVSRLPYGLEKESELGEHCIRPESYLLLDEPMAGMNVEEKEDMCRFILDVNEQFGTTIVLIEHDMGVVNGYFG